MLGTPGIELLANKLKLLSLILCGFPPLTDTYAQKKYSYLFSKKFGSVQISFNLKFLPIPLQVHVHIRN
jgi:hypothetical protein